MNVQTMIDFRNTEGAKSQYLREQTRVIYGTLRVNGTGNADVDTPDLPFGCIKFMETPNLTFGVKINSGSPKVQLAITDLQMDTKGLIYKCRMRINVEAEGDWNIYLDYQIQGKCHLMYETGDGFN